MTALIERSLADSPTLKAAQARLARAGANVGAADAARGPQVNGSFDATRQRFSANGLYPPPIAGSTQDTATLQASGSWDLDLFGRNRAVLDAAIGVERAAAADRDAARVLLSSNVARTYLQLARLVEQREVASRSLAQRDELLGLIRQRVQAGIDTAVELRQGEALLPETRQLLEALDEQIEPRAPRARRAQRAAAERPRCTEPAVCRADDGEPARGAAGRPARPARRHQCGALAHRGGDAATSMRRAPSSIRTSTSRAFVGLSSIGLDRLLRSGSEQYGAGPAIHLPIFDAGRLRANLRGKASDLDLAIENYNGAVVDAVHDVADQLGSLQSLERQRREQTLAQTAAELTYDLATQRYRAGLGTYLTVLNAEASVLTARRLSADLLARALRHAGRVDPCARRRLRRADDARAARRTHCAGPALNRAPRRRTDFPETVPDECP